MSRPVSNPIISALMLMAGLLQAEERKPDLSSAPAAAAPNPALVQIGDVAGLPRVLLMGDSIAMGYTLPVRERLAGRANVHHPAENCGDTGRGLRRLDAWLGSGKWDVVYFNFGLHDLKYLDAKGNYVPPEQGTQVTSLAQYEANLRELVARLCRTNAKLIYATTTPVPDGTLGRVAHDEIAYNAVAKRVMAETGVPVDDLHALATEQQKEIQLPRNVHFTDDGYARLGAVVAASVSGALPSASL